MIDVFQDVEDRGRMEGIALGRAEGRMEGIAFGRMEGIAFGREEGIAFGREQLLFSLVHDGLLSPGAAAARANMSEEEFRARMREQETQGGRNGL